MGNTKIKDKLQWLREQWVKYPDKRKIIEVQAKLLKKIKHEQ